MHKGFKCNVIIVLHNVIVTHAQKAEIARINKGNASLVVWTEKQN